MRLLMHYATNIHGDKHAPDDDAIAPECIIDNPRDGFGWNQEKGETCVI